MHSTRNICKYQSIFNATLKAKERSVLKKKRNWFESDGYPRSQSATANRVGLSLVRIRLFSAARTLPYRWQIRVAVITTDARLCATRHDQRRPRCGATLVKRGRRWLVGARPPIGAFHLSTLMATKFTNHVRRANIIGQFVVVASASFVVVSSGSRRSVGVRKCGLSARLSYS